MRKLDEYEYLVERSKRFYESAQMQIEKGFYDLAAFSREYTFDEVKRLKDVVDEVISVVREASC